MDSKLFINLVNEQKQKGWHNSQVPKRHWSILERIAEHYEECNLCQKMFDNKCKNSEMGKAKTLENFLLYLVFLDITDWVCYWHIQNCRKK